MASGFSCCLIVKSPSMRQQSLTFGLLALMLFSVGVCPFLRFAPAIQLPPSPIPTDRSYNHASCDEGSRHLTADYDFTEPSYANYRIA